MNRVPLVNVDYGCQLTFICIKMDLALNNLERLYAINPKKQTNPVQKLDYRSRVLFSYRM